MDIYPSHGGTPAPAKIRVQSGRGLLRTAVTVLMVSIMAQVGPASSAMAAAPATSEDVYPPLFGTSEVRSAEMSLFPKWQGAVTRYFDERRLADAPCSESAFNRCHLLQWTGFLAGLRDRGRQSQIAAVNDYMNRKRYIIDPLNYGVIDYWATPGQFLRRDGDCEDYAIAKYMSLRALGFDARSLRIVVLRDLNLGVAHAILVVYYGGEALVLDNQVNSVVPARAIRHYQPIYSLNEHNWWLHRL
jgi:predicted transglutaminase-like cysteine proteinase